MTTRKLSGPAGRFLSGAPSLAATCAILACAGCSTPGPAHAYLASGDNETILDLPLSVDAPAGEIPSFAYLAGEFQGVAYEPFTDHLFLRVRPGNIVRVLDRPARSIKRAFRVAGLPEGPGDLAVRSRDRHIFFAHPSLPAVLETTLDGAAVRTLALDSLHGPPEGVAYDQRRDRLLILKGGDLAHVGFYDLSGRRLDGVSLDRDIRLGSLGYDSATAEFYVPLRESNTIGVFDAQGRFLRALPVPSGDIYDYVDVGPRSLIRMF